MGKWRGGLEVASLPLHARTATHLLSTTCQSTSGGSSSPPCCCGLRQGGLQNPHSLWTKNYFSKFKAAKIIIKFFLTSLSTTASSLSGHGLYTLKCQKEAGGSRGGGGGGGQDGARGHGERRNHMRVLCFSLDDCKYNIEYYFIHPSTTWCWTSLYARLLQVYTEGGREGGKEDGGDFDFYNCKSLPTPYHGFKRR